MIGEIIRIVLEIIGSIVVIYLFIVGCKLRSFRKKIERLDYEKEIALLENKKIEIGRTIEEQKETEIKKIYHNVNDSDLRKGLWEKVEKKAAEDLKLQLNNIEIKIDVLHKKQKLCK